MRTARILLAAILFSGSAYAGTKDDLVGVGVKPEQAQVMSEVFGSAVASNFVPSADNTYSLGSSTKAWKDLYFDGNLTLGGATAKIIPGATSLTFRNNADSADNLSIANAGDVTVGQGNLVVAASTKGLLSNTSDGSDSKYIQIAGGGAFDNGGSRGGEIAVYGNEAVGGVGGAAVVRGGGASTSTIYFQNQGSTKWSIPVSGALTQDATNGGNLIGNATQFKILMGTSDAADSKAIRLAGGGDSNPTRGAFVALDGNEAANIGIAQISSGDLAGADTYIDAKDDVFFRTNNTTQNFVMQDTGEFIGSGTGSIGWAVVDGANDTACTSQCTAPAVFGFNLSAGATAPVLVGPSDATADICLCAGAS